MGHRFLVINERKKEGMDGIMLRDNEIQWKRKKDLAKQIHTKSREGREDSRT